jgi:hypothetical protein
MISLALSPVAPALEDRTSVKRFVSLQFLNPIQSREESLDGGSASRKAAMYTNTE